jgi:succinate dehydrogenase hydrophobic anchor subunit
MKWFVTGFLVFIIGIAFSIYALNVQNYVHTSIPVGGFWNFIYLLLTLTGIIYMAIGLSKILRDFLSKSVKN